MHHTPHHTTPHHTYVVSCHVMSTELKHFLVRAEKLELSSFWRWLNARRSQSDIPRIIDGDWLAHDGLSQDELEAFCLNMRFFIQPRDGFSIDQVGQIASQWPQTYQAHQAGVQAAIARLNSVLDARCLVQIDKTRATRNRDLFEVVFYGGIVHANPGKREQFERVVRSGLFSYFVFQAFSGTLFRYRNCIQHLAHHVAAYMAGADGGKGEL